MNNEILINEKNFKKFSKRLLNEIKATDIEKVNLSETQNILSRVLNKKDYNDMKKNINNKINEKTVKSDIFNEATFLEDFLKGKNNLVIAEVINGSFSLNTFFYKNDFKNDTFEPDDYDLVNKIKIEIKEEELNRFFRIIKNHLYQCSSSFDFEYNIDSFINTNDNGNFCEHKRDININPFTKKDSYHSLYVKSSYFARNNRYIFIISKCKETSIRRLMFL